MDFRISKWISGFQSGFLNFRLDFWISEWISGFRWISGFQIGFLPTVYEISSWRTPRTLVRITELYEKPDMSSYKTEILFILNLSTWCTLLALFSSLLNAQTHVSTIKQASTTTQLLHLCISVASGKFG